MSKETPIIKTKLKLNSESKSELRKTLLKDTNGSKKGSEETTKANIAAKYSKRDTKEVNKMNKDIIKKLMGNANKNSE